MTFHSPYERLVDALGKASDAEIEEAYEAYKMRKVKSATDVSIREAVKVGCAAEKCAVTLSGCSCRFTLCDPMYTARYATEKMRERAAQVIDEANKEGPYQAIGAAKRIRALPIGN